MPGASRTLLAALAALTLGPIHTGCQEGEDPLACAEDADCERFGLSVVCRMDRCQSEGITCAERGGLDPAKETGLEELPTYAAALEEWLEFALSAGEGFCSLREDCGESSGAACIENLGDALSTSCCRRTLDLYLDRREALADCPATTECTSLQWESFCPPLADVAFEDLCD